MAGVKVSEYTELASLVGDEKIPTGTGVRKATTPDQLKAFIGNSASKLIDLTDVDAGAAGSADGKFLTEVAPVSGARRFGFVDATVSVGDVVGLQAALGTKEPTIAAGTTSDYYRGDKTFQPLNKAAVGLSNVDNTSDLAKPLSTSAITALAGKLSEVVTPSVATGEALTMVKSGTNGQLKKLIAGQDTTLSSTADTVTVGTTGRTLKDFVEVSETVNSKFYRYLNPNAHVSPETQSVNLRLVGRSSTAGNVFSLSVIDAANALKPNVGRGSVDLQIVRDSVGQTASGSDNFLAGSSTTVTGSGNAVISRPADLLGNPVKTVVSGNDNTVFGVAQTVSGNNNRVLGGCNSVTGSYNTIVGSENSAGIYNCIFGDGARITGSFSSGIHTGLLSTARSTRGMSGVHTQSTTMNSGDSHKGQQNLYAMYQIGSVSNFNTTDWITMTSDRTAPSTTNVYVLSASNSIAVGFIGHIAVGMGGTALINSNIYKIEGAYSANVGLAWTVTPLLEVSVDLFDFRVLLSSGTLLFQVKAKMAAPDSGYNEARANIHFSELSGG